MRELENLNPRPRDLRGMWKERRIENSRNNQTPRLTVSSHHASHTLCMRRNCPNRHWKLPTTGWSPTACTCSCHIRSCFEPEGGEQCLPSHKTMLHQPQRMADDETRSLPSNLDASVRDWTKPRDCFFLLNACSGPCHDSKSKNVSGVSSVARSLRAGSGSCFGRKGKVRGSRDQLVGGVPLSRSGRLRGTGRVVLCSMPGLPGDVAVIRRSLSSISCVKIESDIRYETYILV